MFEEESANCSSLLIVHLTVGAGHLHCEDNCLTHDHFARDPLWRTAVFGGRGPARVLRLKLELRPANRSVSIRAAIPFMK